LAWCRNCGCAQAILDQHWQADADAIYATYTLCHTGSGGEQLKFDLATGQALPRSEKILRRLMECLSLPHRGRFLDVGCGSGALIRTFGSLQPAWRLAGLDLHDHCRDEIERLPGTEKLYVGTLAEVPGQFALITFVHSFEHIPRPGELLAEVWERLEPGGLLLIQVPDCEANPIMYLVADHASHFYPAALTEVVRSAGFQVVATANDWAPREITVVAQKAASQRLSVASFSSRDLRGQITRQLDWLAGEVRAVKELADRRPLGLFGTAVAGTWMCAELGEHVACFVDEDPGRAGTSHLGVRVLAPQQVPAGSDIYIALPPSTARAVAERLRHLPVHWHVPSDLE
jgi:SAM-dependent methyltransferase